MSFCQRPPLKNAEGDILGAKETADAIREQMSAINRHNPGFYTKYAVEKRGKAVQGISSMNGLRRHIQNKVKPQYSTTKGKALAQMLLGQGHGGLILREREMVQKGWDIGIIKLLNEQKATIPSIADVNHTVKLLEENTAVVLRLFERLEKMEREKKSSEK